MNLPVIYDQINPRERWKVREEYVRVQEGLCYHCKQPLAGPPRDDIVKAHIMEELFPVNFLDSPIHLDHDHDTGLTRGAVHSRCNAYMWQYLGK